MAPIFPTWFLRTVVTALAMQLSTEMKTCKIWSSAGAAVKRGSNISIFCKFQLNCSRAMYVDGTLLQPVPLNASTVYMDVVDIRDSVPYSCQCSSGRFQDPCGIDIHTGYPPDRPRALTCVNHVTNKQPGVVDCRWSSARETFLPTKYILLVRSESGNHTGPSVNVTGSHKDLSQPFQARWRVDGSIQKIYAKIHLHNELGSAQSDTYNFSLGAIAKPLPPVLSRAECSSRYCNITWHHSLETHVEIQCREVPDLRAAEQERIPSADSDWQANSSGHLVHDLQPSRQYCFRARAKLPNSLNWSDWSKVVSNRTQEEAPEKELDVWFHRSTSLTNSLTVYWKPLNGSEARGRVLGYMVHIDDPGKDSSQLVSAAVTRVSVPSCVTCPVAVAAYNSKGSSPPARVPTHFRTAQPPQELQAIESKDNVSLYWGKTDPTLLTTGYLVEWYLQDQPLETLQWMRLSSAKSQAVITELEPYECYDGAVYVFYENSLGKASFTGVNTLVSVPTGAPSVNKHIGVHGVTLNWTHIPREQRRGCVRNYTIYVENSKDREDRRTYHVPVSQHQYTIKGLPPATYKVWMTAWTEQGEGPIGEIINFIIHEENTLQWLLGTTIVGCVIGLLLYLLKVLVRGQRLKMISVLLQDIPDPSDSKWAKAFTDNKGKMDLAAYPRNASSPEEEEEHIVKFIEHSQGSDKDPDAPSAPRGPVVPLQTTYIKSLSQDSDSSAYSSQDTGTTAGYIFSQAESPVEGEDEDEEEEEEGRADFYPGSGFGGEPLVFGGGLTLDAVKIDCRNLWENAL